MAAIAPISINRYLSSPPIVYQVSSDNFDLPLDLVWEDNEEGWGVTVDIPAFYVAQFEPQYCVPASGTFLSTGNLREPQKELLQLRSAMVELRAVVKVIEEGRPLPPVPELDDLLSRAVQLGGRPSNIEEWARQLAADVGELVD